MGIKMAHNKLKTLIQIILFAAGISQTMVSQAESLPAVTVYKSPTCGCCKKWVKHMQDNGFEVKAVDMKDMKSIKSMSGVRQEFASCHTARVGGYVVEGHVPASDIKRLLAEKPKVRGLTAPGMPMGSPGMEGPRKDKYQVLSFDNKGITGVYANH